MYKQISAAALAALLAFSPAAAQSKINGAGRVMLDNYSLSAPRSRAEAPLTTILVTLHPGFSSTDLPEGPWQIAADYGDLLLVDIPLDAIEAFADAPAVKAVDFGNIVSPTLDRARALTGVDAIHKATDEGLAGTSYTGRGVTVGLYDTGLDPNHAAFRRPDGSSRVNAIYIQRQDESNSRAVTDPADIANFTTEAVSATHGTHVLGIIAGSNQVEGRFAAAGTSGAQSGTIPYYGSAYEADIIVGCGDFVDGPILKGLENVINRGVELGQPIVANLSLGSNFGSHDPRSATSRFLDALGQKAIITISAGNEGDANIALKKKFSPLGAGKSLNTFIVPQNSPNAGIAFSAEFWGDCEEVLDIALVLYDRTLGQVAEKYPLSDMGGSIGRLTSEKSAAMKEQFSAGSSITYSTGVDSNTGRYNLYLLASLTPIASQRYIFGVNVAGSNGHTCYGFLNPIESASQDIAVFSSQNVSGYSNGSPNGSINGFGCGYNMISVGAYVSRSSAPWVGGGAFGGGGTEGDIASFSSYGETGDGRRLPDICAPGAQVVAPISTYYTRNQSNFNPDLTNAVSTSFDRTSYYYPFQGTSMSSPFVAGVIALWLEACPEMTVQQAKDILSRTAIKDRFVNSSAGDNPLRWGAGKIDALAGLKEAIKLHASIDDVLADPTDRNLIIEALGSRRYSICYPGAQHVAANVYNLSGALVATAASNGSDTTELDASSLAAGVYLVAVDTPAGRTSRKYVVK